jgi:hypothetical protein
MTDVMHEQQPVDLDDLGGDESVNEFSMRSTNS